MTVRFRPYGDFRDVVRGLLVTHEGWRNTVYEDTRGIATIGVGRNLRDKGLSDQVVEMLLREDIEDACTALDRVRPFWRVLPPTVQIALVDMTHNLGIAGLLKFSRMWAALDRRDYAAAAREALDSRWARQVGPHRSGKIASLIKAGGEA